MLFSQHAQDDGGLHQGVDAAAVEQSPLVALLDVGEQVVSVGNVMPLVISSVSQSRSRSASVIYYHYHHWY